MKRLALVFVLLVASVPLAAQTLSVSEPGIVLAGGDLTFEVGVEGAPAGPASVLVDGRKVMDVDLVEGVNTITIAGGAGAGAPRTIQVISGTSEAEMVVDPIPGWLSIVPPVLAIVLALVFKDVLISLFLGVFAGALILFDWNPLVAFARSIDRYMVDAVADADHAAIIIFTTLLGGMVGLITKSGGSEGIVDIVRKWARSRPKGQIATGLMGLFIFFDDYANSLIVGSTMRPITDGLRISREKLAYIVDSTAAPVSSLVPISTWIGFEVGLIAAAFSSLGLPYDGYSTFIASIPFRFYPIFALVMVFAIAAMNRDFGPMLRAERRAEGTGEVLAVGDVPLADYAQSGMIPPPDTPRRAINAVAPILTVIFVTIVGLWITGTHSMDATSAEGVAYVRAVFESANSYQALMWASLGGVIVALVLPAAQRLMPLSQLLTGMVEGFKAMLLALVVLVLAWSIGAVAAELHTADYVVGITQSFLSPHFVGVVVFLTAAGIAFATGTSWGTMAILMPLVIPIAHGLSVSAGHPPGEGHYMTFMLGAISSVLAGSVWGDHCSPISDTTILSSMASGCDHVAHVRTQIPYAVAVGVIGMIVGDIPTGFGVPPWISLVVGTIVIILFVRFVGQKVESVPAVGGISRRIPSVMTLEKGSRLGPYEIIDLVGAGGMGEVYRARDPRIAREVAIKILPPEVVSDQDRLRRFEQEARAAGALNHPNLVTIHDIGRENGAPYIVMELLEGATLRERMGEGTEGTGTSTTARLASRRVVDWGVQMASGLAAAHKAGIIHRDLKPENVFLTNDGRLKILDFGLAKLQQDLPDNDETIQKGTDPGTVMGTAGYMSPEQVRGVEVDHRSDIFSLGTILYELVSGHRAFQRETRPETMAAILREDPEELSAVSAAVPPELVRIVEHCLEKHPEQRFQSARDLAFQLEAVGNSSGSAALPAQLVDRSGRWRMVILALLLAGAGFAAGWLIARGTGGASARTSPASALSVRPITFSGRDLYPDVSPDGTLMAFVSDRDGVPRIWIKQLSGGGGELALTEGPDAVPRFSPDGATILFSRKGEGLSTSLYKVPLIGGAARKLIDDANAGDWSPDGQSIVFTRIESKDDVMKTVVLTAAANGSNITEIAGIEGKNMVSPRWSPDGRRIVVADASFGNYEHQPLLLDSDGSRQEWIVLPVNANLQGAVAWVDASRLLIGTLPSATSVVSGSGSLLLLHDVDQKETSTVLYVSSLVQTIDLIDDGRIMFDAYTLRQNLREVSLDTGESRWLSRGTSVDRQPSYSPDGREIIFSSNMSGNLDLWVLTVADGSLRRLTDDEADDYDPAFTRDGKSVLWSSRRGTGHYEIWMANRDGTGAHQISNDGIDAENPTSTRNDEWILYNSYNIDKKGIWKVRPDGSETTRLARLDSELPEASPDGEYVSFHGVVSNDVKIARVSDGELFSLGALGSVSTNPAVGVGRSRWKPGSNLVVFVDMDDEGVAGLFEQPFIPGRNTRSERRKFFGFDKEHVTESFAFSPDGEHIAISSVEQLNGIMISDPVPALARK